MIRIFIGIYFIYILCWIYVENHAVLFDVHWDWIMMLRPEDNLDMSFISLQKFNEKSNMHVLSFNDVALVYNMD